MIKREAFSLISAALWIALVIGIYLLQFRDMFDAIVQTMRMTVS